jgi:antitoxin component YwqK of YwqJK toxin-antitoxin module
MFFKFRQIPRIPFVALIILTAVMSPGLSAQDAQNFVDDQGRKQGYWRKWEGGELQYEGQFKDDKPYGKFTYYYPNRGVKAVTYFSAKGSVAHSELFYQGGKRMAKGQYFEMQKDSVWEYYNDQGQLVARESYDRGVKDGPWITYYADGQPSEEVPWVKGSRHGQWKQFYPDGTLKSRAIYMNDRLEGLAQFFFPDGKTMMSGTYANSLKDGTWIIFQEEGRTVQQETWSKGYLVNTKEVVGDERIKIIRDDEEGNQFMPGRKPPFELEDPEGEK